MRESIKTEIWKRTGITVLWDLQSVSESIINFEIITINQLFKFLVNGWPEELPSFNDSAIVVSGLESILDTLDAKESEQWLEKRLYPLLLEFQNEYEGQAALIFLIPQGKIKIKYITAKDTFEWLYNNYGKNEYIPFSLSLWNGAEKDVKYVYVECEENYIKGGLYLQRIS